MALIIGEEYIDKHYMKKNNDKMKERNHLNLL
jgi:hypothetical protein